MLYIDIDPQANGTTVVSGGDPEHDITMADLLDSHKKIALSQAIYKSPIEGVDYIPSAATLGRTIELLSSRTYRERVLTRILQPVTGYDWIIIDCPPDGTIGTLNAMVAADSYLIPIDGGSFALNGLSDLLDLLEEVNDGQQYQYAIVRNEYSPSAHKMNKFLSSQLEPFADKLFTTKIQRAETIQQAAASCMSIRAYQPSSRSAQNMKDLAREVVRSFCMSFNPRDTKLKTKPDAQAERPRLTNTTTSLNRTTVSPVSVRFTEHERGRDRTLESGTAAVFRKAVVDFPNTAGAGSHAPACEN